MADVFISYSRLDKEFVDQVIRRLQERRISAWIDRRDIRGGADWQVKIRDAIVNSKAFVLILSPNIAASDNVADELSIAKSHKRPIVPVISRTCDIPSAIELPLTRLQRIDFPALGFEEGLRRLVEALQPEPLKPAAALWEPPRWELPRPPPPPPPPAGPSPQELAQLLCGRWNIQIGSQYIGKAQLLLNLYANGAFEGQLMSGAGVTMINGGWQVTPAGELMAQGEQIMGWMRSPYFAAVRFTQITRQALAGVTRAGEQVAWTRIA